MLLEWVQERGLLVVNEASESTCVCWQGESVIDVTFVSPAAAHRIIDWRVEKATFTCSDHRYVTYGIRLPSRRQRPESRITGWATRRMDVDMFEACMAAVGWPTEGEGEERELDLGARVRDLRQGLRAACEASMPKRRHFKRKALYWWSATIAEARRSSGRI